jgi:drug/metabolite transporter (DMT)-like permease
LVLHERLTGAQVAGIVLAIVAAILLSQEPKVQAEAA